MVNLVIIAKKAFARGCTVIDLLIIAKDVKKRSIGLPHPGRDVASEMALCFDLTQNTNRQVVFDGVLPTFRSSRNLLWSPARKRWLTFRERAACMGYPVYPDLAASAMIELDTATLEGPRYAIGNSMHVANVGAVLAVALMATEPL